MIITKWLWAPQRYSDSPSSNLAVSLMSNYQTKLSNLEYKFSPSFICAELETSEPPEEVKVDRVHGSFSPEFGRC
jgi:hypothetical protein